MSRYFFQQQTRERKLCPVRLDGKEREGGGLGLALKGTYRAETNFLFCLIFCLPTFETISTKTRQERFVSQSSLFQSGWTYIILTNILYVNVFLNILFYG